MKDLSKNWKDLTKKRKGPGMDWKRFSLFLFISLLTTTVMGQQKKSFTLEDLMPGGKNFQQLQPENMNLTWWGDFCIERSEKDCKVINMKNGNKTVLFTLEQIQEALETGESATETDEQTSGTDSKKLITSCAAVQFPDASQNQVLFRTPERDYLIDFKKKEVIWSVTNNTKAANADWNPVSRHKAYTLDHNLYVMTAEGKELAVSTDGSNDLVYGQSVHRDEFGISKGTFWSPDGKLLAFYQMDQSMVPDYPQMNINTRMATTLPCKYPMAGEKSHKVRIGIFNPKEEKTVWLQTADPTDRYFTNISWAPDGKKIYVIELNRDQNHAQLVCYHAATGKKEGILYEEKHDRYVEPQHPLIFLPWDDSKFIYQSQRDGYNHLYLFDLKAPLYDSFKPAKASASYKENVKVEQITSGPWVTLDVLGFNTKEKSIIIRSNELNPIQYNLFNVSLADKERKLLGTADGVHTAQLSESGKYLIDRYSSPTVARSINLIQTHNGKSLNLLTAADPWEGFNVPEITCGTIKAADNQTDLYYRMVKPVNFDPNKKYPTIVYVYGGPHAHLVEASRNYLARGWEIYMAQKGYLIFVLDSRGSENRGLEFENVTFRQLGEEEMKDQMQGVKYLQSLPYVDADRMGVHGWSFGGFMTTNLMLSYPETFKVGVAGGPVLDWQYYEVMYGERYMDTPQSNPEGYKKSNLREKAGQLQGRLQVIIGFNDPVCLPQHSLSFLRSCIDAGKQVDYFVYPGGEHNMYGRDQIHLHERITRYFEDFLK